MKLGLLLLSSLAFSQVGIGTSEPHESAILEINSVDKGLLPPRIELKSENDGTSIIKPAKGLVVYNPVESDNMTEGLYINLGTTSNPRWYLTTPRKIQESALILPGYIYPKPENNDLSLTTIFDLTSIPTVGPFVSRKMNFQFGYSNYISNKIVLPKDGVYVLMIRPTYLIELKAVDSQRLFAEMSVQFIINKNNNTFDHVTQRYFINSEPNSPYSGQHLNGFASTLHLSGRKGDEFYIEYRLTDIKNQDQLLRKMSLVTASNSGYSALTLIEAQVPSVFYKE